MAAYFVTGATGFLGRELVRQLRTQGHEVHALVRNTTRAGDLHGAQPFIGDITDQGSLRAGMQGVDGVFHVAGWYKLDARDRHNAARVNVEGTRNTLTLMRELGIRKGVYTSSLVVHSDTHGRVVDETYRFTGKHLSVYDRTKAAAHDIAREMIAAGLPLVIGMPGVIYGPGDKSSVGQMLHAYERRQLPMVPRRAGVCWGFLEDVARGHILAMEKGRAGESYHLCGEPLTFVDALELAESLTGIPAPPSVPPWMLLLASPIMGLIEKIGPLPETYSADALRVAAGVTYWGDNTKARHELGFEPRTLREGLKLTFALK